MYVGMRGVAKVNAQDRRPEPKRASRAVAVHGASGRRSSAGGRGDVAEAMLAAARANGVEVRRDADLAETLSALDPAATVSEGAVALTAAALDRLYKLNAAAKAAKQGTTK